MFFAILFLSPLFIVSLPLITFEINNAVRIIKTKSKIIFDFFVRKSFFNLFFHNALHHVRNCFDINSEKWNFWQIFILFSFFNATWMKIEWEWNVVVRIYIEFPKIFPFRKSVRTWYFANFNENDYFSKKKKFISLLACTKPYYLDVADDSRVCYVEKDFLSNVICKKLHDEVQCLHSDVQFNSRGINLDKNWSHSNFYDTCN